ncbi:MAG: hypothetical protein ABH854_05325 [Candidatus Diapherotrites archaeon]|nr:hypothetical protein [Candidatus Micrarchaeota archaeon]MBU1939887.1 hypothetical protein [Candidatus Micrarchaeota archaeon]
MLQKTGIMIFAALLAMLLLSGCPQQPTGNATLADSGTPETSQPTVGELVESGQFPLFDRGNSAGIRLDINEKTISFDFDVGQDDVETMAAACSSACEYVPLEHYSLMQVDGKYVCECSGERCEDKKQSGVVMRYCDDVYYIFTFTGMK